MTRTFAATARVASCLLFLFVAVSASAALETDLQALLEEFLTDNPAAPGVVVCAICPALDLDWTGAAGYEDRDVDRPLTGRHTFRIASNTKTYVAAAILRLAELGMLGLDDSFGEHLPERYRRLLADDGYDLRAMTLRQVLSHTSGLFEHPKDPRYAEQILADPQHAWTRGEQVARCVEWGDKVGEPGELFSYSDTGYILLGAIIEEKTGKNLGVAVRDLVGLDRHGLRSTWWELLEPARAGAGPRAHQYYGDQDANGWHPGMDLHGGGGLITDARDLALFPRKLLQGEILREDASLGAMTGCGTAGYRLGLICLELDGRVAWGHTGFWNTFVFHVPALDLTVSGCVLNHFVARGQELAEQMVQLVAAAADRK